jgi:hypothetical protein
MLGFMCLWNAHCRMGDYRGPNGMFPPRANWSSHLPGCDSLDLIRELKSQIGQNRRLHADEVGAICLTAGPVAYPFSRRSKTALAA